MKPLAVITGASSGLGKAMAQTFSSAGHPLLLIGRRIERLQELNLPDTICAQVDVRDREAFARAVREAETRFGPVDLLINNAGIMLLGNVETQDAQEWQDMLDVNVMGTLNGMGIVLEGMKERHHGTIINLGSIAGVKPFANHAVYCASKYAVEGMSEVVRMEAAAADVRVARILPGAVNTELLSHTTSDSIKASYHRWLDATGVGRIAPEDIAKAAWFIYSMPQEVNVREIQIADTRQDA